MKKSMKNVFISHHHKDDASVDALTRLVAKKGITLRNSSIRVNPDNQERIKQNRVSDRVIERLIRAKMRWAGQLMVVIGKETHLRPWVEWEIKVAHKLGMPIIGVYEDGLKDKVGLPENLEAYATSIVGWRSESIVQSLEGDGGFQDPDGSPSPKKDWGTVVC